MRNNPSRKNLFRAWRGPAAAAAAALLLSACGALPPPAPVPDTGRSLHLEPLDFQDLPGWKFDDPVAGLAAFLGSCPALARQPAAKPLGYAAEQGTMGDMQRICANAAAVPAEDPVRILYFFETSFRPYRVLDLSQAVGKFTGYYEPLLRGSWQADKRYRYPVYAKPHDIVVADLEDFDPERKGEQLVGRLEGDHLVPYYDRRQIEQGALQGRQLELMWVDNVIDRFFLHIQGSGRVRMPDGSDVRLAFAGRNGQRYTPIGRELVAMGALKPEQVSLPTLRAWMAQNPVAAEDLMLRNRSYIFFRVEKQDVIKGALGVPLTAGRSMAVDPRYIPLGLPLWLVTTDPADPKHQAPLRRLVVAQDTGSAIKGPVRGDLFWGFGAEAEARAGVMNEKGVYYLLLPRHPVPPGS